MRSHTLLATLLLSTAITLPVYAQTLDGQMQNLREGRPAVPASPAASAAAKPTPATTAPESWPANPAVATIPAPTPTAPAVINATGGDAIPALPLEILTSNGITYINGGIGDEERTEIKAKASEFNLQVMLSDPKGEFISDVQLRLLDAKETVLVSVDEAGPYFYAHLAPGNYFIQTSVKSESVIKKIKFTVPQRGTVKEFISYNQ